MSKVRLAIVGAGNCASSLVQGVQFYRDVPAGEVWSGIPSRPTGETKRIWAGESQLPELIKRVRALEKRVRELEERRA